MATLLYEQRKIIGDPLLQARTKKIVVTAAQVNALRATPKTLVAAQGTNRLIQLIGGMVQLSANTTQYTESSYNLVVRYTNTTGVVVSQVVEMTGFITQSTKYFTSIQPCVDGIVAGTASLNQALVLHNNGAAEFGNTGTGILTIWLAYRVWDMT